MICRRMLQVGFMASLFVTPEAGSLSKSPGCLFFLSHLLHSLRCWM